MKIQQIIEEQKQNINEEEIEKLLKNRVYALICEDCGGGGANGQDKCKKCDGHGLHTWETTKLKNDLTEIITTHTRKLIEAVGEEITGCKYKINPRMKNRNFYLWQKGYNLSVDDSRLKLKEIISSLK